MTDLYLVQISQPGIDGTFHALALKHGDRWLWYPDPVVELGEEQRIVKWKKVSDIEGWNDARH